MEVVRTLMGVQPDRDLGKLELVDDVEVRLYTKTKDKKERTFCMVKARRASRSRQIANPPEQQGRIR
jgi:hypothetical protein